MPRPHTLKQGGCPCGWVRYDETVCVCVREREREGRGWGGRENKDRFMIYTCVSTTHTYITVKNSTVYCSQEFAGNHLPFVGFTFAKETW